MTVEHGEQALPGILRARRRGHHDGVDSARAADAGRRVSHADRTLAARRLGYIINAMRDVFAGHYLNSVVIEGIAVAVGLAAVCLALASRAFAKENA